VAELKTPRRYYLHKRLEARLYYCDDSDGVWKAKQEAQPGTPLPDDFAHRTTLADLGYTASEDLDGADADELERAGLTQRQATEVIAALAAL
jgi:hypothetical protein